MSERQRADLQPRASRILRELPQVAGVALDGVGGQPPFCRQMREIRVDQRRRD